MNENEDPTENLGALLGSWLCSLENHLRWWVVWIV
jgi:hypothetical protein